MKILWLNEIGKANRAETGGKAATLASLLVQGFPIPLGFVIPASAMRDVLQSNGLSKELVDLANSRNEDDQAEKLTRLSDAVLASRWPPDMEQDIVAGYETLGGSVAVRSSGVVEDSATSSFAGAYESLLDRRSADQVLAAILECWASAFSVKVATYRAAHGLIKPTWLMGVIVQRMVSSDKAGVMFTLNPYGDGETLLIEAISGSCDQIVSGRPSEQTVEVDRASRIIMTNKQAAPARGRFGSGASSLLPAGVIRTPRLLRKNEIVTLIDVGMRIETAISTPADVEWAIADGKLAILQARPITASGKRRAVA